MVIGTNIMVGIGIHSGTSALHATVNPEELRELWGVRVPRQDTVDTPLPHTNMGLVSDALTRQGEAHSGGTVPFPFESLSL